MLLCCVSLDSEIDKRIYGEWSVKEEEEGKRRCFILVLSFYFLFSVTKGQERKSTYRQFLRCKKTRE